MRQYVSTTHADPEVLRRYAAGEGSFDDIAEDRGPRVETTLDSFAIVGRFAMTRDAYESRAVMFNEGTEDFGYARPRSVRR